MIKNPFEDIPPRRRELYFQIINGEQAFDPITLRLHFLNDRFPADKLDRALEWLIKNRIVGKAFIKWVHLDCHNSDLEMHRKLLTVVDNAPSGRVIGGKNFRL